MGSSSFDNVLVILVDDLGWNDLGYSGSEFYETPHIDALSRESVIFTNAYAASPVCSPTRAAIMTGQHPARVNITDWIPGQNPEGRILKCPEDIHELPLLVPTLANVFKDSGYRTFFAGKWHLGSEGFLPSEQGFDFNLGGHHRGSPPGGYYSPYENPYLSDGPEGEYLPDRLTNEAISFLQSTSEDPSFLFLSYYTVHTPIQAARKHIQRFEGKLKSSTYQEVIQREEGEGRTRITQNDAAYASMVYALDQNIGRLITQLKEAGTYDNTTIIFTSDNGGLSTLLKAYKKPAPTSVAPLRGGKGWLYEGGIRIPLLIKPARSNIAQGKCEEMVISHDLYPTILSVSGIPLPEAHIVDGLDLSPLWKSSNVKWTRNVLFWHFPHYHGSGWTPGSAVRHDNWKLIHRYEPNTSELYDLSTDLSEQNDVSLLHPDKKREMVRLMQDQADHVHAQSPTPSAPETK